MKKIVLLMFVMSLLSFNSFALELGTVLTSTTLSNNVFGEYVSNGSGTTATEYSVSTGHAQGNKIYMSGSYVSELFVWEAAEGVKITSADLFKGVTKTDFDSSTFDGIDSI